MAQQKLLAAGLQETLSSSGFRCPAAVTHNTSIGFILRRWFSVTPLS